MTPAWQVLIGCAALAVLSGCGASHPAAEPSSNGPERGAALIRAYGCGACHRIPDIPGAKGNVGPPLERLAERVYLAGFLPNTQENLARWIRAPQQIAQGSAMPDVGVTAADAEAMAAYFHRNKERK